MRIAWLVVASACGGSAPAAHDAALADARPDAAPAHLVAYAGGYTTDLARLDVAGTGVLVPAQTLASFAADPSFLAIDPAAAHLYAVSESTAQVGAYTIDPASGALAFIGAQPSGGSGPAYVAVDPTGAYVLVANYTDGKIAVLAIQPGGGLAAAQQVVTAGANAHEIVIDPSRRYAFAPCLGSDWVAQYTFDAASGALAANAVPHFATATGAGPRHLAFAPDGKFAYLIAEKASTVTALALDGGTGQLSALQTISTLPAGFTGSNTGAEVWVHPSGAFVLASNRGDDSLAIFARDAATGRLTAVGYPKTDGMTPRDFTLDPAGRFVYVANQGSNSLVTFAFDAGSGTLAQVGTPVVSTMPTFVGIVALPI